VTWIRLFELIHIGDDVIETQRGMLSKRAFGNAEIAISCVRQPISIGASHDNRTTLFAHKVGKSGFLGHTNQEWECHLAAILAFHHSLSWRRFYFSLHLKRSLDFDINKSRVL
jgi:hypothetical protein